jgi:hypothetical protein
MLSGIKAGPEAPAELIAAQAAHHAATVIARNGGELLVTVRLLRADGREVCYALSVDANRPVVSAREQTPLHLPAFCPDRHINENGSFCMNWQAAEPLLITDTEAAERWWGLLLQYLRLQERASRLGRWPSLRQWAHGEAADHQIRAELCAEALGAQFVRALATGNLHVTKRPRSPHFLRLQDGPTTLYSVWAKFGRVATLRQGCFCGSGRPLRRCEDHADRAAELVEALEALRQAEHRFWRRLKGRACCGTMSGCPLAPARQGTSNSTEPMSTPPAAALAA